MGSEYIGADCQGQRFGEHHCPLYKCPCIYLVCKKSGLTLKAKDKAAFLLRNGFPAHDQRSSIWHKARTIVGQISHMDKISNLDVKQLANRFCALVDPALVQLYGSNADTDLHQMSPDAAKDIAVNLHNKVRQLWMEHANREQHLRLEIEAETGPSAAVHQPVELASSKQAWSSKRAPADFGVSSFYNTTFKNSTTGCPSKLAKVSGPSVCFHCWKLEFNNPVSCFEGSK